MMKKAALNFLIVTTGLSVFLFGMTTVSSEQWVQWGRRAALFSAGLRQPQNSVTFTQQTEPTYADDLQSESDNQLVLPPKGAYLQTAVAVAVPKEEATEDGDGIVRTQQMSVGTTFVQGVAITNRTGKAVDIAQALAHKPGLSFRNDVTAPQVLIIHTHTTECYLERDDGFYRNSDNSRTDDPKKNMTAVGKAMAAQLKMAGIGVIHDTAVHDQPYNGAYAHAKKAIEAFLKEYPTIRVVIDLHRDAIYSDQNTRIKPTTVIDGKKAAQAMIIVGMMNSATVQNPHTQENLSFAVRLQQRLHTDYPTLMRPLNLANARYNHHLTNGSLLIEVGSDVNTLEEALYSAQLIGNGLAQVLREEGVV